MWCRFYGTPESVAAELRQDPWEPLKRYRSHLGKVRGERILNPLGSIGRKAVPLAMLGADVTVVDISPVNARFAQELAEAAGVKIKYLVSDLLKVRANALEGRFDLILMEGGILHYFFDLNPLARWCHRLLSPSGRLIIGDHHPIGKCVRSEGYSARLEGDYFDTAIRKAPLPLIGFLPIKERGKYPTTRVRYWTMAEIVTAFARADF
jgi:SAM-dependent methyltransferase